MDERVKPDVSRRLLVVIAVVLIALAGLYFYQRECNKQEEYQTSLGLARVLSATFEKQAKLNVGEVKGALDITTVDPGMLRVLRTGRCCRGLVSSRSVDRAMRGTPTRSAPRSAAVTVRC